MSNRKTYKHSYRGKGNPRRQSTKRPPAGKRTRVRPQRARIDPGLKATFRKIGVPEPKPFQPDPFQLEALEFIKNYDVLVSAPTGAGKTWIASESIAVYLSKGLRVWYASPLKALSNSIYQEFSREFGPDQCGILTGDRKENPGASVIVGTTEILRNQLYDAMHKGVSIRADLVILDEAHYLSDPERGVVWEEVLIYLPPRVRFLLLSATISNAEEVCAWLEKIRECPNRIVRSDDRPVPMEILFLFPDGLISPLSGGKGLTPKVKEFLSSHPSRRRGRPEKIDYGKIIGYLREVDLLPAIFFLKSRADCDKALLTCPPVRRPGDEQERLRDTLRAFLKDYPHLKRHRQIPALLESRVGSHHAGQLPYWKVLIEKCMNSGFLEAMFSTSTVAAGVNFPARTVVLVQSDRFNGREFTELTATEFHQMIGRAGRRGKDHIGFALVIPGRFQDPQLIHELRGSPPDPILSQIHINFSMTLNLFLSHNLLEVKDLLKRSFAAFQETKAPVSLQRRWERALSGIKKALPHGNCDINDPFEVTENIDKRFDLKNGEGRAGPSSCHGCQHLKNCPGKRKGKLSKLLRDIRHLSDHMEEIEGGLWLSFKRHVRFLKETGFVDETNRLTPDGYWASNLRVDQPLLIAEVIRKGPMEGILPETLAGILAPFVWDRDVLVEVRGKGSFDLKEIEHFFYKVLDSIKDIVALNEKRGFECPPILFWPAAALFMWAKGVPWERLLNFVPVTEGDMASLIMRTADHLRQVMTLRETHPGLAFVAEKAVDLVLREPVYIT